ncbi:uncharacterized protein BO97DRAFT_421409 [Aspergillus homomorphus CBS 101889]|uniref:Uncharacterized protein n=1 Tax=Aspergillus homomorphus (strain CBS 101889) TaxID=1450537 RepID=A0A395IAL0_ASPHC|nr:hypothetical protein BO97DRAFT_421409 [Aspergillus homomorphus CBS 101889]RAL16183.1 hypothetical protein BO97DRAFT_421409 [Aspergillus homomorphus CBS 101889]
MPSEGLRFLRRATHIIQNFDVDLEVTKLAIFLYGKRNIVCHAWIGNPVVQNDSCKLRDEIERAKARLSEALPEALLPYRATWERTLDLYVDTQSWIDPRPGSLSARPLPEPDLHTGPGNAHRAFENKVFESRVDAFFQTSKKRIRSPLVLFSVRRGRGIVCRIQFPAFLGKGAEP